MNKTQLGLMAAGAVAGAAMLLPATAGAQTFAFGLTNSSIFGASVERDEDYPWLHVGDLSRYGYKGLSVKLGEADSGLFFTPSTRATLEDGYSMSGHAYGKVGFLNRRLSSVYCERTTWATFPLHFDFSPLGASQKTVFAYVGDVLVASSTFTGSAVTVYSSSDSNLGPRVNPFWRAPDGTFGALLELSTAAPVTLPSGRGVNATRLYVRADNPIFDPEYVSRVDIYGGGGLPEFTALDERLGMFGNPHRALGKAAFNAKDGRLTVAGCADAGTDGVLIETRNAAAFQAGLRPVSLQRTGAVIVVSATSAPDRYRYYSPPVHLGALTLENRDGSKELRMSFDELAEFVRVDAFVDGAHSGHAIVASTATAGLGTNDSRIVSVGVSGAAGTNHAGLQIGFAKPVTARLDGATLRGDQFLVSLHQPTNDVAAFSSLQMLACGTSFTITAETAVALPAPDLAIRRSGTNIFISWPAHALDFMGLQSSENVEEPAAAWHYVSADIRPASGTRVEAAIPFARPDRRYFRLVNFYVQNNNGGD